MAKSKPVAKAAAKTTERVKVAFVANKKVSTKKAAEPVYIPHLKRRDTPTNWIPGRAYLGPVSQAAK